MYYERGIHGARTIGAMLSVAVSCILVVVGLRMLGDLVPEPRLKDDGVVFWLVAALGVMVVRSARRDRSRETHTRTSEREASRKELSRCAKSTVAWANWKNVSKRLRPSCSNAEESPRGKGNLFDERV